MTLKIFILIIGLFFLPLSNFAQTDIEQLAKNYLAHGLSITETEQVIEKYKKLDYKEFKTFLVYQEQEEIKFAQKNGWSTDKIEKHTLEIRTHRLEMLAKSMELFGKPYNQLEKKEIRKLHPPKIRTWLEK